MRKIITVGQIVISVLLVVMILMQAPADRNSFNSSLIQPKFTRRGVEKLTFFATIFLLLLFLISSFFQLK